MSLTIRPFITHQTTSTLLRCTRQAPLRQSATITRTFSASTKPRATQSIFASLRAQTKTIKSKTSFISALGIRRINGAAFNSQATAQADLRTKLLYGAGIFGATVLGINLIFNRETREDGGMPPFERSYLNDTFMHTGLGIGIIGLTARQLHVVRI
jgi:growth hormone-inducible transmembrane protein